VLVFSQPTAWATQSFNPYASVIVDSSQVISGGLQQDFTSRLLFDGGFNHSINHHSIFVSYQAQRGANGSMSVGDIQGYSNIDEANFSQLNEAFYQYDGQGWFSRFGKTDANSEFAVSEHALKFINSSMGVSPTVLGFPTYPHPALSAIVGLHLTDKMQLVSGIFAAHESDNFAEQFYVTELRYQFAQQRQIKLGLWHDTNQHDVIHHPTASKNGTSGYYVVLQQSLVNQHWFNSTKTNWYSQFAYGDEQISEIQWHFGAGLELISPFKRRQHSMGLGLTYVKLSQLLTPKVSSETAIELFYLWPINHNVIVKPDLQYIISPAGNQHIDNALVFTLRLELNF
jgi:carbohydrate-selective porin OprB